MFAVKDVQGPVRDHDDRMKYPKEFKVIDFHTKTYAKNVLIIDENRENEQIIPQTIQKMKTNRFAAQKYNYALDKSVQNFSSYACYLQLSQDGKDLLILNKKIIENPKHVLEADPVRVEEYRTEEKK